MSDNVGLVHPIYLDVPMMISFVAALEGGYALENTQRMTHGASGGASGEASGGVGLPSILSNFVQANLSASGSVEGKLERTQENQIVLRHTEASLFMRLRDELARRGRLTLLDNLSEKEWNQLQPFQLAEMSGVIFRSPINEVLQLADRITTFIQYYLPLKEDGNVDVASLTEVQKQTLHTIAIIQAMHADVQSSPIFDMVLHHQGKAARSAVLDMQDQILSIGQQELLLCGRVVVLGKITRVLTPGEEINLYRRSILGYMASELTEQLASTVSGSDGMNIHLQESTIGHPAVEIVPMAIFV